MLLDAATVHSALGNNNVGLWWLLTCTDTTQQFDWCCLRCFGGNRTTKTDVTAWIGKPQEGVAVCALESQRDTAGKDRVTQCTESYMSKKTEEAVACAFVHVNVYVWVINIREMAEVHTSPGLFPWARPHTDKQLFTCYFPEDPGSLPCSVTVC